MKKSILIVLGLIVIVGIVFGVTQKDKLFPAKELNTKKNIKIGLSLDTLQESRWEKDRDAMIKKGKEMGVIVIPVVANSDDKVQIRQIESLITQKVDVIIIVAHNGNVLAPVVKEAKAANIKVIAYDRMIQNSDLDMYVSFDSVKVGKYSAEYVLGAVPATVSVPKIAFVGGSSLDNNALLIKKGAMEIIDPLVKSGKAKLVYSEFTKNWSPEIAYESLKKYLENGGSVDAVVASNDGTALGAIQALTEYKLDGKVPVSGQDAELTAVKRLIEGTQTITLYKPIVALANKAVEIAVDFANGKTPKSTGVEVNGEYKVASYLIDPIPVTKNNIKETVIKDGFYSQSQIYSK